MSILQRGGGKSFFLKLKTKLKFLVPLSKLSVYLNPLYTGNSLTCTLANSIDPDEMQHKAAFHLCLHCLVRLKQPRGQKYIII